MIAYYFPDVQESIKFLITEEQIKFSINAQCTIHNAQCTIKEEKPIGF